MTSENHPPYPRLGELYRALGGALDTKAKDRNVDRLAREGEYDWSLLPTLQQTLITKPLRAATDNEFAELVDQFADHMRTSYLRMVAHIALDRLTRAEALPLLIEHYFAPQGASLLLGIKKAFGGPDLMALLDPAKQPLAVVLDWFDKHEGRDLARRTFPESTGTDRSDRELVSRWANGTPPDLSSIKRFVDAASRRGAIDNEQASNLRRWMIVARALAWLEKESPLPFRPLLRRHLLLGLPEIDIVRVLSLAIIEAGERFSALTMPASMLYEKLKPTRGSKPEPPKIPSADQRGLSRARSMG